MKIVDLAEEHKSLFAVCLEDWSPDAADEVFIDGKTIQSGPPPSYEKIKKAIARKVAIFK